MNNSKKSFKNHFLVAMPCLHDPLFHQSVIYICEHSEQGAMGLIINRPSDINLSELLGHVDIPCQGTTTSEIPIFFGGPVAKNQGMVLHDSLEYLDSSTAISETIFLSKSIDILKAIANQRGPKNLLVTLGYVTWSAGQLEQEISNNGWLTVPANDNLVFHSTGKSCWQQAAFLLGVNIQLLPDTSAQP